MQSIQGSQVEKTRSEKRAEQKAMRKAIKSRMSDKGNIILKKEDIDFYIKEVETAGSPYALSPDKNSILCLCQDFHKIKKTKKGKELYCPVLDIRVQSFSRAVLVQKFIRAIVEMIKLENAEEIS